MGIICILLQMNLRGEMSRNTIKTFHIITGNEGDYYPYIVNCNKYFKNQQLNYNSHNRYISDRFIIIFQKKIFSFEQINKRSDFKIRNKTLFTVRITYYMIQK